MVLNRLLSWTPFGDSRTPWTTLFSYIFDYAIIVILAIAYAALDRLITPFNQQFSLTDLSIQYPFAEKERIPIFEAVLISCLFPAIVIALYTLLIDGLFSHRKQPGRKVWTFKDRLWELNCGILGLFLAQGAAFCITGSLKNLIGRPRPDLISRCRPPANATDPFRGLSVSSICTQDDRHIMADGFRSFPSGHSSSSFAGLFYLSLYLAAKLHIMDQRGEVWRTVIVIVPTMAAACIASSRIMDYRHHAFDVLFGSAIGLLCGWGAYRQYFPPLRHSWLKGRAYPMREWGVPTRAPPESRYNEYGSAPVDRTGGVMGRDNDAEDMRYPPTTYPDRHDGGTSYGLEPLRSARGPVSSGHPSPGFDTVIVTPPQADDTDYEHVRPNKPPRPIVGVPSAMQIGKATGGNTFRNQVAVNQVRRTGTAGSDDEDDRNYGRPF